MNEQKELAKERSLKLFSLNTELKEFNHLLTSLKNGILDFEIDQNDCCFIYFRNLNFTFQV